MPVHSDWDNDERTALRLEFQGNWKWEEVYAAVAHNKQLIDTVPHIVDTIIIWDRNSQIPDGALTHTRRLIDARHQRVGITVIVNANSFFKAMWKTISKVYETVMGGKKFAYADTLEEARALLAQHRMVQTE